MSETTDLTKADIERIKGIAGALLQTLKAEKLKVELWRDKESTRDAVRQAICDFLYEDTTGLPVDSYTEDEVFEKADNTFNTFFECIQLFRRPTMPRQRSHTITA